MFKTIRPPAIALFFLSACFIALFLLSTTFEYTVIWQDYQVYLHIGVMCAAGLFFLALIYQLCLYPDNQDKHSQSSEQLLTKKSTILSLRTIFIVGLSARILFIPTNAILEDDFYRYFFDGSLVTQGATPYKTSPNDILQTKDYSVLSPNTRVESPLNIMQVPSIHRVAYPDIQSIYPPVAQIFFTLSSVLSPFSVEVWRVLLICMEVLTFCLCIKLLNLYRRPKMLVALYWLNPLIISEGINAAHMDILLPPFLLGTLLSLHRGRYTLSALLLACAVGIKLWPILLAPLIIAKLLGASKQNNHVSSLVAFTSVFSLLTCMLLLPQLLSLSYQSGLHQYSQYWQVNSFLFSYLNNFLVYAYEITPFEWLLEPEEFSRLIVAATVLVFVCCQAFIQYNFHAKQVSTNKDEIFKHDSKLANQWLSIAFLIFILSPTGYPWYVIWFMPLLCLAITRSNWAILLLTISLPLYDLRYPEASSVYFDTVLVPLSFAPIITLLIWQYFVRRQLPAVSTLNPR